MAITRVRKVCAPTLKETPADATLASHQLMLRAGLIRQVASGLYTWLPNGLRVLRRVEHMVREAMEEVGCGELLMPMLQPSELWEATQRWNAYGKELMKVEDRHGRWFCLGPTHEEVITSLLQDVCRSYKQLPCAFFQVQTKVRDEIRPRFGVMRAREFVMKDAYSFHHDTDDMDRMYHAMFEAYQRLFKRMGLNVVAVAADSGSIGGDLSHEFHVLADSGEDALLLADDGYAANVEKAAAVPMDTPRPPPSLPCTTHTDVRETDCSAQCATLGLPMAQMVKVHIVQGKDTPYVALALRADHTLSATKAGLHPAVANPLVHVDLEAFPALQTIGQGFLGPNLPNTPLIVDHAAAHLTDFATGANRTNTLLVGANWGRDLPEPLEVADLRQAEPGDPSPLSGAPMQAKRGIEVGHIFQLGTTYTAPLGVRVLGADGTSQTPSMGCYGIGLSRVVAACIEQCHDERGIVWPLAMAPYHVHLLALMADQSPDVREHAEHLALKLADHGFDVYVDDRDLRPGVLFAEADLFGLPLRVTLGPRGVRDGLAEVSLRDGTEARQNLPVTDVVAWVLQHAEPLQ